MSRASIVTLVVLIAVIVGIGYYASYEPTGGLRAECTDRFNQLDAMNDNDHLEYGEFLAYGNGVSMGDFTKADTDKDDTISVHEFCSWTGAEAETG